MASGAGGGSGALKTYEIELDNAFGLVEGGDLKIGGVKAGQTTGFEITRKQPYRTIVTAEITEPGFDSLRTDGRCDVRQQSLIGEYFIDCDLGTDREEVPDGGRIPVSRTSSTIPPDLINTVMRRPQRERFRLILNELGTGLAGRPEELNRVIRRAHPALRELSQTLHDPARPEQGHPRLHPRRGHGVGGGGAAEGGRWRSGPTRPPTRPASRPAGPRSWAATGTACPTSSPSSSPRWPSWRRPPTSRSPRCAASSAPPPSWSAS